MALDGGVPDRPRSEPMLPRLVTYLLCLGLLLPAGGCGGDAPAPTSAEPAGDSTGGESVPEVAEDGAPPEAPAEARAFLWRVQQGDAVLYLLGSVHVGTPDFYPLPASVEAAFEQAGTLAFELDMAPQSQQAAAMLMAKAGMFPPGETLWDALSPETAALLKTYLGEAGQPEQAVAAMRPWLLGVTLTMAAYMQAGLRADLGIDLHLHGRAVAAGKRVVAIEQAADQVAALADHPAELQDLMLRDALESLHDIREGMDGMVELWRTGDAEGMAEEIHESMSKPQFEGLYKAIFIDRNVRMAEAARGYLKAGGTTLVVVGSGHLVGKGSVVDLLSADLPVTQL